jgi:hypothetical protein
LIEQFAMFSLSRAKPFMVDQPRLLFEPLVPARGASLGDDDWPPFTGQRRLRQPWLMLAAAATRDYDQRVHHGLILTAGKAHVDGLNIGEVVALDDALFDQSLENPPTPAAIDAELVGQ